jgi:hypothetical protein
MIVDLNRYFSDESLLDEVSVSDLELLVQSFPYSSAYKALLDKKMKFNQSHGYALQQSSPTFVHYGLHSNTIIPNISSPNIVNLFTEPQQISSSSDGNTESSELPINQTIVESNILMDVNEVEVVQELVVAENIDNQSFSSDDELIGVEVNWKDDSASEVAIETANLSSPDKEPKTKKKSKKFKLNEFSGISEYAKWLLSFKNEDIEKRIKKEEKAKKKKQLEDTAMKSITKSDAIISEPLAEILFLQGHLDDAKKMYEQLMHKYPEKSSYFAGKINNLIKI